jgi:hypothetical protein
MMEMSMEGALSVLSDPAVLALEGALFTAWALAEVRLQKKANQAKEYAALNGKCVLCCHESLERSWQHELSLGCFLTLLEELPDQFV